MATDTAALLATTLSRVIDGIKTTRPTQDDGSPLALGYVYSQLELGRLIDPDEFAFPWSPTGEVPSRRKDANGIPIPPTPAERAASLTAANHTIDLCDDMLAVTEDGRYIQYPGGKRISAAYVAILNGMQADPYPPMTTAEKRTMESYRKVLFTKTKSGELKDNKAYVNYQNNAKAYTNARATLDEKQSAYLDGTGSQAAFNKAAAAVDAAYRKWRTRDAAKIEQAINFIESQGVPFTPALIAAAKKTYAGALRPLLGGRPHSYISPPSWADPTSSGTGWVRVTVDSSQYQAHYAAHQDSVHTRNWNSQSHQSSGEGGISFLGIGVYGKGASGGSSYDASSRTSDLNGSTFTDSATNLSIELEYGMCEVVRPWLIGNIFYVQNWHLKDQDRHSISTGTLDEGAQKTRIMPMIPSSFLVIRNVKISSSNWGSDQQAFNTYFAGADEHGEVSTAGGGGGAIVAIGPIVLGGGGNYTESRGGGTAGTYANASQNRSWGSSFDGTTLTIKGAQIIGWLSTITPASPPKRDPKLP